MIDLKRYKTIIFDCDGVILDSNKIKTDGFFHVTKKHGETLANKLVEYHIKNGGKSRQKKFRYFYEKIYKSSNLEEDIDHSINEYGKYVKQMLMNATINNGLKKMFAENNGNSNWLVVSGGNQEELNAIFKHLDIFNFFNGGIFGNPDSKEHILKREILSKNINFPALYIGDSKYDYEVSFKNKIEFCFASNWSEFVDWKSYFADKNIFIVGGLQDLVST